MSVIAARVYSDRIIMAADSIICTGDLKENKDFSKMVFTNGILIGSVGYAEEASIMWHFLNTHQPKSTDIKDILDFIVEFAKWKEDIVGNKKIDNHYLMAFKGHLYSIEGLFVREIEEYYAIGAGMPYALAALHLEHDPKEAVKVACELCCYVSEPIKIYTMMR